MAHERGGPFNLPEHNNYPQPERGGIGLGITTQDRSSTPTREAPQPPISPELQKVLDETFNRLSPPPTPREIQLANSLQRTWETRIADKVQENKWLKFGIASGLIFGGTYAAVNELGARPAIERSVNDLFDRIKNRLVPSAESSEIETNKVFDNSTVEGVIAKANKIQLCQEEIDNLPTEDDKENPLYLSPLILDRDTNYVRRDTTTVGLKDVKAGTPIIAGRDGYAFSWYTTVRGEDGKATPATDGTTTGIRIVSKEKDGNARLFNVDTSKNISNPNAKIKANIDIPYINDENSNGRDFAKGLPVKRGDILGYTEEDIDLLQIQQWVKEVDGNGHLIVGPDEAIILEQPNFITQVDESGSPKIVEKSCSPEDQLLQNR